MKSIEVREQVRLSLAKCMELVLSGLRFRLFRAGITVAIIALASAFLMTMLSESVISSQAADAIERQIAPRETFLDWVGRLSTRMTPLELLEELATSPADGPRWQEFRTFYERGGADAAQLSDEQLRQLRANAIESRRYLTWLAKLKEGERRPLVGRYRKLEAFKHLLDEEVFAEFQEDLRDTKSQLPTDIEAFRQTLETWAATRPARARILRGHAQAVGDVKALLAARGGARIEEALAAADAQFRRALEAAGFVMSEEVLQTLREQAQVSVDITKTANLQQIRDIKMRLARRRGVEDVAKVNARMLFDEVSSRGGAEWLRTQVDDLLAERERLQKEVRQLKADRDEAEQRWREARREAERRQEALSAAEAQLREFEKQQAPEADLAQARARVQDATAALKSAQEARAKAQEGYLDDGVRVPGYEERKQEYDKAVQKLERLTANVSTLEAFDLSVEQVEHAAERRLKQSRLNEIESSVPQTRADGGFLGFAPRTLWLIVVSFIVCIVGIANAMLMSVTERFREIATMKCLGATDGFIMVNFILESMMQGVAGGVIGTILGALLGLLRGCATFGWTALFNIPGWQVLAVGGVSLAVGVVVSAVAAVYPAWVAARLASVSAWWSWASSWRGVARWA